MALLHILQMEYIYIWEQQQENFFSPERCFRTHRIVWLLKIDFPSPCGLYMEFLLSKGKHLQSIDELLFVDSTVTGPHSGKSLINMTGIWLQMYYWDANGEHRHYCLCRFFQKASPTSRTRGTNLTQWILPFDITLIAKTHSYISLLCHLTAIF